MPFEPGRLKRPREEEAEASEAGFRVSGFLRVSVRLEGVERLYPLERVG